MCHQHRTDITYLLLTAAEVRLPMYRLYAVRVNPSHLDAAVHAAHPLHLLQLHFFSHGFLFMRHHGLHLRASLEVVVLVGFHLQSEPSSSSASHREKGAF